MYAVCYQVPQLKLRVVYNLNLHKIHSKRTDCLTGLLVAKVDSSNESFGMKLYFSKNNVELMIKYYIIATPPYVQYMK